jgi:2-polyprenyl-6-methoxyphenol hydroxylase-like FAD-dependent oxidoreductase
MPEKVVVVGAGPVGSLAALYAAKRGHEVEIYELRPGMFHFSITLTLALVLQYELS